MVCDRCIRLVKEEMEKLGFKVKQITLGEITFETKLSIEQEGFIAQSLYALGFELLDDKKSRIIEKIKNIIIKLVHQKDSGVNILPAVLSSHLQHNYNYLDSLFSEVEGTTIEKYFTARRVERVKELLVYNELTFKAIAAQLNYPCTAHLSTEFKNITGLHLRHFKHVQEKKRQSLEQEKTLPTD